MNTYHIWRHWNIGEGYVYYSQFENVFKTQKAESDFEAGLV